MSLTEATRAMSDFSAFLHPTDHGTYTMDLAVDGIRCAACMSTIERAMHAYPGVRRARVNLAQKRLTLEWSSGECDPAGAIDKLHEIGFTAFPFAPKRLEDAESREHKRLIRALGVAAFGAMNIMLLSVAVWSGHETGLDPTTRDFFHWVSALIALPVVAYSGRPFFDSAIAALKRGRTNMDVPISIGILLALCMSVAETWNSGEHAYFDGAVMLIFFLLVGRTLDRAMLRKTRDVAANVAALRADFMLKRLPDGSYLETPSEMIEPGDIVLVRPGDRVGVDGIVEAGRSDIDQSLVTGETAHRAVMSGDQVHAGALNLTGALSVRALKPHSATLLADVERLLAKATEARGAYVRLADRAARLYAPFVHSMALITFIGWMLWGLGWQSSLVIAITVLIITCPCALGLAIPAVQVVAAGALFRSGVLANSGDALERLAEIDTVVFDKTGTLTLPKATVANLDDIPPDRLALAGRLALTSRHPVAGAIAAAAGKQAPLANVREVPGQGVAHDGLKLGSPAFCDAMKEAAELAKAYPDASVVAFRDGASLTLFAIRQPLRPDAGLVMAQLAKAGLKVEILSGDRDAAVAEIARELGIDHFSAAATPADKVARLEALKSQGRKVLMVGDGLNDAPALAAAHVSISPVSATHLAQAQADFLILGHELQPVVDGVLIARKARSLMMQNLWLSVIYNIIAVPVAIAGLATPLVAAVAMSGSSIIVTLNALRARKPDGHF